MNTAPIDWKHQKKIEHENSERNIWIKTFIVAISHKVPYSIEGAAEKANEALDSFKKEFSPYDYEI